MIDPEVVRRRLRKLDELLKRLRRFGEMDAGTFSSQELGEELASAAGLRNILVYLYLDVDPARVHETARDRLGAFQDFARCILDELEQEK